MLNLCPPKKIQAIEKDDVPCVMCEFAMKQLEEMIKDNKTEVIIFFLVFLLYLKLSFIIDN